MGCWLHPKHHLGPSAGAGNRVVPGLLITKQWLKKWLGDFCEMRKPQNTVLQHGAANTSHCPGKGDVSWWGKTLPYRDLQESRSRNVFAIQLLHVHTKCFFFCPSKKAIKHLVLLNWVCSGHQREDLHGRPRKVLRLSIVFVLQSTGAFLLVFVQGYVHGFSRSFTQYILSFAKRTLKIALFIFSK